MTETFAPRDPDFSRRVHDAFARQGLMTTFGARIVSLEPGLCVIEMAYDAAFSQQRGYFHGGVVGALGDNAAGFAAMSLMPAGSDALTVEYKINLMRPALPPTLRAEGRVLRAGRTLTVCRADVFYLVDGRTEACALLQSTLMRIDQEGQ